MPDQIKTKRRKIIERSLTIGALASGVIAVSQIATFVYHRVTNIKYEVTAELYLYHDVTISVVNNDRTRTLGRRPINPAPLVWQILSVRIA